MVSGYRRAVLPNGLRVLGVENRALRSFVCSVYVRGGPRFEAPEQTGLTHLLEHMLMQGSVHFPSSNAIMRSVEDLGGVMDARTYAEYLNVVFGAHRKHWERLLEIASDVLLEPLFDEEEVEQEKLIVAQEIAQHRDRRGRNVNPSELAYSLLFRGEVLEAGTRGSPEILARLDAAAVRQQYERFFTAPNCVICLAGGMDFDKAFEAVQGRFSAMPAHPEPPAPVGRPVESGDGWRALYRETEALTVVQVLISQRAYAFSDPRFDAARAVNQLLGGGLSSRLFTRVREELGLVYDVESHLQGYSDIGTLDVFLSVDAGNLVPAVAATIDVLNEARAGGFTAEELERYKESARCGMDILCDQPSHLAEWFGRQEVLLGSDGVVSPAEYVRRQESLTLEDLRRALDDVLADGADFIVVGPFGPTQKRDLAAIVPARELVPPASPAA